MEKTIKKTRSLFLFGMLFFAACNYSIDKTANNPAGQKTTNEGAAKIVDVSGDKVTLKLADGSEKIIQSNQVNYELIGPSILAPYCLKCHTGSSAPKQSDFKDFAGAKKWAARILARASDGTMPPQGEKPSAAELKALEIWVANGTPEK